MQKISPSQLRAARALLNWSRADLTKLSGISEPTIHRFENGVNVPESRTAKTLINIFDQHGVEFLEKQGVRLKSNDIEVYEGPERFEEFYEFIYEHLDHLGGDVCVSSVDERQYAKYRKNPEFHWERMRRLVKRGDVKFRIIVQEGDYHFTASSYAQYKWLPKEEFAPTSFYAFGKCLALISFSHDPAPYVVLHKSGPFAEAYRKAFDVLWKKAKVPPAKALEKGLRINKEK